MLPLIGGGVEVTCIKSLGKQEITVFSVLKLFNSFFFFQFSFLYFLLFVKIQWSLANLITSTNLGFQFSQGKVSAKTSRALGISATGAEPALKCLQKKGNKWIFC